MGADERREVRTGAMRILVPPSRTCGIHRPSAFDTRQSPFGLRCERL